MLKKKYMSFGARVAISSVGRDTCSWLAGYLPHEGKDNLNLVKNPAVTM
jgi:hypothetical protein